MNRILENEIQKFIGRFPTEGELKSVNAYINSVADDNTFLAEVKGLISNWIDEQMVECANCGKWIENTDVRNGEYFCDNDCADEYEDSTYDMHAEAKAEYYATHK